MTTARRMPWWAWAWPLLAWVTLAVAAVGGMGGVLAAAAGTGLVLTVFAAVYHAEVVAHRVGEPFGTLVLAVAVTVIEVALIVSVMIGSAGDKSGLARDTVFAAVMIICNGLVGLCLVVGGVRHYEQGFQALGASAGLAVLATLVTLTLILPNLRPVRRGALYPAAADLYRRSATGIVRRIRVRANGAAPGLFSDSVRRGRGPRGTTLRTGSTVKLRCYSFRWW